jgi:hypothetical protein
MRKRHDGPHRGSQGAFSCRYYLCVKCMGIGWCAFEPLPCWSCGVTGVGLH